VGKREYQNQNAIETFERGALYDKFVGFVINPDAVGTAIG
jgi:hypothetical protein